ncbi:MAG TPA: OmpA family protein [Terracidiphilus sp.]|nr:OmpA family protein [Terracidiphilus sp.]
MTARTALPGQIAVLILASAIALPAVAQDAQPQGQPQDTSASVSQQPSPSATQQPTDKEGFWGHLNPFARKKWVKKRIDPMKDQLSELDEVNAKNSRDIKDVDSRAQAGIQKAQSSADQANQAALAAGSQAQTANGLAEGASNHVSQLNTTVNGLDQYHQITDVSVAFRSGAPVLSSAARKQLDDLAASLAGHQGYIIEMEAHAPYRGSVGIQRSERLAEAVERYLVTEHQIPVYRMHYVAMGNARAAQASGDADSDAGPVRHSTVHIRLMENSLAAQGVTSPHDVATSTGADRP